jgi:hypothetical protein
MRVKTAQVSEIALKYSSYQKSKQPHIHVIMFKCLFRGIYNYYL